jgi:hypothetical protein
MSYLAPFFAGVFLCNSIPHLTCGLTGIPFPTPFATPRGVGESQALTNFYWGFCNLLVGLYLLSLRPVPLQADLPAGAFLAGILLMGTYLSRHFGKVRPRR